MWLSTLESGEVQLCLLQKSRRNHRSCVWIEALPVKVFVPAQIKAIHYSMNTYPIYVTDSTFETVDPAQLLLRNINQAELTFLMCERTEALSVMVFVLEQKLSTIVWTPIQYVTVYFRDVPGAALLRHRNRAEITLLMYEQKAYPWI